MAAKTLFVRNLPANATDSRLEEIFSEIGPLKSCFTVKEKGSDKCRGFGYVTYSMAEDGDRALQEVKHYDGRKITVVLAKNKLNKKKGAAKESDAPKEDEEVQKPSKAQTAEPPKGAKMNKKARLIIRNLSFKCSEENLKETFSAFGTVLEANIPLKPDGKKRGFAFVQFKNMAEAGRALAGTNQKQIQGRVVAVDWAVAKDKFTAVSGVKKEKAEEEEPHEGGDEPQKKKFKAQEAQHRVCNADSDDDDDDVDADEAEEGDSASQEADSNASSLGSDEEEDDDDDGDDDDDDGTDDDDDDDDDDDGTDDDDDDDDDNEDSDGDDDDDAQPQQRKALPSDVGEGRTVFIRNLAFCTEEDGLEEALLRYGELKYVRIVMHPDTEHSKGCAFAQFKSKEAAEKCIAAAQVESELQSGGMRLDGRRLIVTLAVTREDAIKLKSKRVKTHTGTRNLYLAREGLIRAGTKAAEGVSDADMAKRARFEELKRQRLKDVCVFVSCTRLCVHNLPRALDQHHLRKLCLTAAGAGKNAHITECRVMYDRKPEKGQVVGRSLGYGFVEFKEHEHALHALRHLNNNPSIFSAEKRPIVEFSLEDSRKLKLKENRRAKSQQSAVRAAPREAGGGAQVQRSQKTQRPERSKAQPQKGVVGNVVPQSGHFSGFRTQAEVEHVELADGKKRQKVLPMPSHRGPKIRHRDKGKQVAVRPKQKAQTRPSRRERKLVQSLQKPTKDQGGGRGPRRLQGGDSDGFDRLVEQYKSKLTGAGGSKGTVTKKKKWFS